MSIICQSCQQNFEPRESWQKVCYDCFKAGKAPKTVSKQNQEDIMNGLRQIYSVLDDIRKILQQTKMAREGDDEQ